MDNWQSVYEKKQQLNRYPFSEVVSFCMKNFSSYDQKQKIALDVGSGSGVHSDFLAQFGFTVLGIEGSQAAVENAKILFPRKNISYKCCYFEDFKTDLSLDMVLDRLSTTHSSLYTTINFYQDLRKSLNSGAKIFWQGFSWDNSARKLGEDMRDGSFSNFTGGILKDISPAAFFKEEDIINVFEGYKLDNIRLISDLNINTKYNHSMWTVEATYDR